MPDVGDLVVLTLTVADADTDTVAVVRVWPPAGDPLDLTAAPADPGVRDLWRAELTPSTPGTWSARWTVTGSGAGTEWDTVQVGPDPAPPPAGIRIYATTAQLAAWLDSPPPEGAARLLRRASRRVDELLRTACYTVDAQGMPTDPAVAAAMADATCAQVEWWGEIGDDQGSGAVSALAGAQIGSVRLPSGAGAAGSGGGIPNIAPDAVSALRAAGLLGHGPKIPGGYAPHGCYL